MKTTKIIALLIMITQIVSLAAFGLSIYSIYGVLSSTFSGGLGFEMDFDETTGVGSLRLEVTPQNTGYLDADITLGLKLLDGDGVAVASDSSSAALAPGSYETISLVLEVSREDYERIALGGESSIELFLGLRTLFDLVGISDTITIPQGVQG
ncbi:MAG: hypothetical protein NWE88_10325 [Candidatus Bathyarchaeota archaeon]|nr:hypothetical protein [Candidatus Bathyarchaeota archaeon]